MPRALEGGGHVTRYLEALEGEAQVLEKTDEGTVVAMRAGHVTYLGGWFDGVALDRQLQRVCKAAGLPIRRMPEGVRVRASGDQEFWFNYSARPVHTEIGEIPQAGLKIRHRPHH